jgi:DNA replication and repair protein RecF
VAFSANMYLTHLSLTNFRNFARLDVDFPRGSILLLGSNAQGKTSFLEAIYFLATFTSFHASHDRQLINFLAAREPLAVSRIVAHFSREAENHQLEVRIIQEANSFNGIPRLRKEILWDGVKSKISDILGKFNAVLFMPQMMRVIEGTPDERRRYLNLVCSQVMPRYPIALTEYNRALSQRNALLKQLGERGGDWDQLNYWDEQIVESGAFLIYSRIRAIQELEHLSIPTHQKLTRGNEILRLDYQPAYDPARKQSEQFYLPLNAPANRLNLTLDQIKRGFQESLGANRGEEIARGMTTLGPHRDELRFMENGIDLETYGSRGQVRTAILTLKLAEVAWMHKKTGQWPVLLLDEVLAELDKERRDDLLKRLLQIEQVLLTTADLDLFSPDFVEHTTIWRVEAGRLDQKVSRAD